VPHEDLEGVGASRRSLLDDHHGFALVEEPIALALCHDVRVVDRRDAVAGWASVLEFAQSDRSAREVGAPAREARCALRRVAGAAR